MSRCPFGEQACADRLHALPRYFMRWLVMLVLLFAAAAVACRADDMDKANKAYERADYVAAAAHLRPLAEAGDPLAQLRLGVLYHEGLGVDQDDVEASKWWRKAADQGYAEAEYAVALCYDHGRGVVRNQLEAAGWYEKAAIKGHYEAQANLGAMYTLGEGVNRDLVMAWIWLSLAAEQGHDTARKALGIVSQEMTADQLAQAQQRLLKFEAQ